MATVGPSFRLQISCTCSVPRVAGSAVACTHHQPVVCSSLSAQWPLLPQEFEAAGFEIYGMSFDKPKSQVWAARNVVNRAAAQLHCLHCACAAMRRLRNGCTSAFICRSGPAYP